MDRILCISICHFQNPLSYEPILVFLLYTDLYVVIFKLLIFLVGKILAIAPPPPVPTAMSVGIMLA